MEERFELDAASGSALLRNGETYNSSWDSLKNRTRIRKFWSLVNYQLSYRRVYSSVGSWLFHLLVQNFLIRVLFLSESQVELLV